MNRRYHSEADEDRHRFWSGVLVAIPVAMVMWVLIMAGAVSLLKLAGWLS